MIIHWAENPLKTTIELDDSDRERILLYLQNEKYSHILCDLILRFKNKIGKDEPLTLKLVEEKISSWNEICNMKIDHEEVKELEEYLQETHIGDCTCHAASCLKCHAEEALGINTIQDLGKHPGNHIFTAFYVKGQPDRSLKEVLEILGTGKEYVKPDTWPDHVDYYSHVPRWESERKQALTWLLEYSEKHGFDK